MTKLSTCTQNSDPLKLIRDGTSQEQRFLPEIAPAYAPVDARRPEHAMVFALAFSKYLQFYGVDNTVTSNWEAFFSQDVSVQLAIASIQDIESYKASVQTYFDYLRNHANDSAAFEPNLKTNFGYLFSMVGSLAMQLDILKNNLPKEIGLKNTLQNLIRNQLSTSFRQLLVYHKTDFHGAGLIADVQPDLQLFAQNTQEFSHIYAFNFSSDWITDSSADWQAYTAALKQEKSLFGVGNSVFESINQVANHSLFTAIFDSFLRAYSRTVQDAKADLALTFSNWDQHQPHYALFLSFLQLFDYVRAEVNILTQKHLDFYYRDILKLKQKPSLPSKAHLILELAKQQVDPYQLPPKTLFKAGKDDSGKEAVFASQQDFIANQAKVTALKTLYRHINQPDDNLATDNNRLFASPVANSADGVGGKLINDDPSWQPFFNKLYTDRKLQKINMPPAELGFALASHYLWMAEGTRTITLSFNCNTGSVALQPEHLVCLISTEKGWFETTQVQVILPKQTEDAQVFRRMRFKEIRNTVADFQLVLTLAGADPAVAPYNPKTHGYDFATDLPMLLVKLRQQPGQDYAYSLMQDVIVENIQLSVDVKGIKTLAISNDFGPIDASKPFQPFGALPLQNSGLVIGSKEVFQKDLAAAQINVSWQATPSPYPNSVSVFINTQYLQNGSWQPEDVNNNTNDITTTNQFPLISGVNLTVKNHADFSVTELYSTTARQGFVRLSTSRDFGQAEYEKALIDYIHKRVSNPQDSDAKPVPPSGPFVSKCTLDYTSDKQVLTISDNDANLFATRAAQFFHLTPFGQCEQHAVLTRSHKVYLLPQFSFPGPLAAIPSNAEFYIGISGLQPPQNLALLFQVSDGTANPLANKASLDWSYLRDNEWQSFDKFQVQDGSNSLLNSGIISFTMPADATAHNSLLPTGQYWIRAAVASNCDGICRLLNVAAQALTVSFLDHGNDPAFPAKILTAGTISKLDLADAAVKQITQPYASFGGRGGEPATMFYTRISERLRHKDRGISLWDYEHLILESFPEIYKVKCLNHTLYDKENGNNYYQELAPGHVTIVTIPNQQFHNQRDPLRPYTSLGLLQNIHDYLQPHLSCFVKLHVKNPLFEEIAVNCNVRFFVGYDETFYGNQLQEAITRFLSPWAFSEGGNPNFGGKIHPSALTRLIESQPYVDYLTDLKLIHTFMIFTDDGSEMLKSIEHEADAIVASKASSVLVSARHHDIQVINPADQQSTGETCPCVA